MKQAIKIQTLEIIMHKIFTILLIASVFLSCSSDDTPTDVIEIPHVPSTEIITIPIVVHVINYTPDPFVISDEKIIG
jgi:hypothetical protein